MRIGGRPYRTVWLDHGELCLINQHLLPFRLEIVRTRDYRQVASAIRTMVVRGAPAIGAAGAFGMALAAASGADPREAAAVLRGTRPTAQDLFASVDRVLGAALSGRSPLEEAQAVADEYVRACEAIGDLGAELIHDGFRLNTHCNAGWLATVDWGTATAPMYKARRRGVRFSVLVDETRPRCQGSRLTAFELGEEGIDHAIIADNAAGWYMARGEVDLVIVGADRIAANGDVANKIGTYSSAVVARENGIPFYVAAPAATIDPGCATGAAIPIEERGGEEVSCVTGAEVAAEAGAEVRAKAGTEAGAEGEVRAEAEAGRLTTVRIAPEGSPVKNPAFDVTPARYVAGIITERGLFKPHEILAAVQAASRSRG